MASSTACNSFFLAILRDRLLMVTSWHSRRRAGVEQAGRRWCASWRTAEGGCRQRAGLLFVAVDGIHGEGGKADGDVFGAAFLGSGVADPLAGVGDDGLSGGDVERTVLVFNVEGAFENDGEFVEGGSLAGLEPSGGAAHVGDAGGGGFGVDASDIFVDQLGFIAGGLDARGLRDECGHGDVLAAIWNSF